MVKVAFIIIIYKHATILQPSRVIICNHASLMIAESSNGKVVCGVAQRSLNYGP